MCVVQEHIGSDLYEIKIFRGRVMKRKQLKKVHINPLENNTRYPAYYINNNQVCNYGHGTEEA
jgi:hypothetical protein